MTHFKAVAYALILTTVFWSLPVHAMLEEGDKPRVSVLTPLEPYNWRDTLVMPPPGQGVNEGNQALHFSCRNKHFTKDFEAVAFVEKNFKGAKEMNSDAAVIRYGSDAVSLKGAYLEMGVCTGKTINFIAALNPEQRIYGFDSFEGLPEDWVRKDKVFSKGTFGYKEEHEIPYVLHNVTLYKGWFKDVLPVFKQTVLKSTPIAFLHIDSDIYSAANDVFVALGDNIVPGTVIVFDEFYNYPGCEEHEQKAFAEFLTAKKIFDVEYLAFNENHEQVAVRIVEKK